MANNAGERGVRILSLDGGGMRGLVSIELLSYVSRKLYDDPSGRKLFEQFDLICGTSTGGILAIGLCQGFTLEDAKKFYLELGTQLFSSTLISRSASILRFGWERAFYSADSLEAMLKKYLGTVQLQNVIGSLAPGITTTSPDTETTIDSNRKRAFVVSTNITKKYWKPYLFRTYDFEADVKVPNRGTSNATNVQALRATSAAPTYFKAETINSNVFSDGGLTANNPSEIAVTEAKMIWPNRKIDLILSVGTGKPKNSTGSENLLPLFNEIVDVTTDSSLIHHRLRSWVSISLKKLDGTKLIRLNPRELGSIPLNESQLSVLNDMMEKSIEYMEQNTKKVAKIAAVLGVNLEIGAPQN